MSDFAFVCSVALASFLGAGGALAVAAGIGRLALWWVDRYGSDVQP